MNLAFQISAALLDACVLAVLSRGETYGYVLTQNIKSVIDVSESTLYPVLRRLEKDGGLSTFDQPFNGRNRRYYAITQKGGDALKNYIQEWEAYKNGIDQILKGEANDEQANLHA